MDHILVSCMVLIALFPMPGYFIEAMDPLYLNAVRRAQCESICLNEHGTAREKRNHVDENGIYKSKACNTVICKDCKLGCTIASGENDCDKLCKNKTPYCHETCLGFSGNTTNSTNAESIGLTFGRPKVLCRYIEKLKGNRLTSSMYMFWPIRPRAELLMGNIVFVVTYTERGNQSLKNTMITYSNQLHISKLKTSSAYKFTVQAVTMDGIYSNISEGDWISSIKGNYQTPTLRNLSYTKHRLYKRRPSVLISWDPGEGPPCFYKVFGMSSCKKEDYKEMDLKVLHGSQYWINGLHFDCNYIVKLQPFGGPNFEFSGNYSEMSFVTPKCLNVANFNYSICAPENVTSIQYTTTDLYTMNYSMFGDIKLSWNPPKHAGKGNEILEYRIRWQKSVPFDHYHHLKYLEPHKGENITGGDQPWILIEGIHWYNIYRIEITARSRGGVSNPTVKRINFGDTNFKPVTSVKYEEEIAPGLDQHQHTYVVSVAVSIGVVMVAFCVVFCIRWRRENHKRHFTTGHQVAREEEFNPLYRCSHSSSSCQPLLDEQEIDFSNLSLQEIIGEGAFGKVHRAEYDSPINGKVIAAVKMLKDFADRNEQRNLMSEIEAMKQLGSHPNIVSMLGYCTRGPELCLLMDYCPLGDLRKYLLSCRHKAILSSVKSIKRSSDSGISRNSQCCTLDHSTDINYTDDSALTQCGNISHSSTDTRHSSVLSSVLSSEVDDDAFLHEATLLSYARQIAMGMEYLSSKNFIHRDLAARNILMYDRKRLKISDFGLSRYIYETNMYQPTSARKLPYKWMAIESIFDQVFTNKSDIWSFGIVLWEIVTLGGCPYPGIPNEDLFHLLKDGYRMERPENCSPEIYQIMLEAWHPDPSCRPTFTDLRTKLESMLELTKSYINLSVSVSQDYYQNDTSSISEDTAENGVDEETTRARRVCNHVVETDAYAQSNVVGIGNEIKYEDHIQTTDVSRNWCKLCEPPSVESFMECSLFLPSHAENAYVRSQRSLPGSSPNSCALIMSQLEQANSGTLCETKSHDEVQTR